MLGMPKKIITQLKRFQKLVSMKLVYIGKLSSFIRAYPKWSQKKFDEKKGNFKLIL